MPTFSFRILDAAGTELGGEIAAADRREAAARLRAKGGLVLDLRERPLATATGGRGWRPAFALPTSQSVRLFRQLALMLRSGLPLVQALQVIADHSPHRGLAGCTRRMIGRIQAGSPFSEALAGEGALLPDLAVRMVATGEASGELERVLERIAIELERRAELRTLLLNSMLYPGMVALMTGGVVVFLVTKVIPAFAKTLQNRNVPMPASTQALVDISAWTNSHLPHLVVSGAFCAALLWLAMRVPRSRLLLDRLLLRLPLIGGMLVLAATAHLGRTLSTLLASGVPALEALRLLRESYANRVLRLRIAAAEAGLLQGRPLSELLRGQPLPAMVPELVAVGETAGDLDRVLADLGDHHEALLRQRIKVISLLIEPAMILIVGGLVGFVYISFFQVIFQMASR